MIRFTLNEENFVEFKDLFVNVSENDFLGNNFESFSIGGKEVSIKDAYIIKVNVKDAGSVTFALPYKDLPKYEVIEKITQFKKSEEYETTSEKDKYIKVVELLKGYKPYYAVYRIRNALFSEEDIKNLIKEQGIDSIPSFYIEEKVEEVVETPKVEEAKETNWFKKDLKAIAKNKYHFIFLTVSSFLFGFAFSVGFCNSMVGKLIAILFYVCAAVGLFLDTYVYVDYFKIRSIKNRLFVYSLIFNAIGMLIALGTTLIFYAVDNSEIKTAVSQKLLVGITIGGTLGSILLSICIGYFVVFLEKKFKKQKPEEKKEKEN